MPRRTAADYSSSLALPGATFGIALPYLQIQEVVRSRFKAITRGLPHAIEIADMCMGAGLDFPGALRMVSKPTTGNPDAVVGELSALLEELELGHTRKKALKHLAERVPTRAVEDFTYTVIQADQEGNPLARVLHVQGRMLSMRRRVAAEEAAARAGVLIIAPMVLLLGCIMLLLMGPLVVVVIVLTLAAVAFARSSDSQDVSTLELEPRALLEKGRAVLRERTGPCGDVGRPSGAHRPGERRAICICGC